MPDLFKAIGNEFSSRFSRKDVERVNRHEGFNAAGKIILADPRGTRKAEIPTVTEKGLTLGSDPLAIYKLSGAKQVNVAYLWSLRKSLPHKP